MKDYLFLTAVLFLLCGLVFYSGAVLAIGFCQLCAWKIFG